MTALVLLKLPLDLPPRVLDGADADDDDEGEHDRVLDGGRAVFGLDELDEVLRELTHVESPRLRS